MTWKSGCNGKKRGRGQKKAARSARHCFLPHREVPGLHICSGYATGKKKGHERPRLKIISATKAENKKNGTKVLPIKSAVSSD